jgi:hypothetical protein
MSAATPEEGDDAAMEPGTGGAPQLSAQALVEALQAQVLGDLEAGADDAIKSVLGPVLDMLKQAQAAIASLSQRSVPGPVVVAVAEAEPAAGSEAVVGARVAHLRDTFERPGWGKDKLLEAVRAAERKTGPY